VQNAGQRAHKAQARLNRIAKVQARRTQALATASAPTLSVSGDKLSWTGISGVSHYVLVTKVPGQAAQYSLVSGTSTEPPVVPGETVSYSVRADVGGSAWSAAVSITYPSIPVTQAPAPTPTTPPSVDLLAAPDLAVSGTKLQWNKVGDVTTYVLVSRVSGQADQYTAVAGTSVTPAAQSGKTVFYSVRTAIDGSAWSPSVSIKYPAVQADATPAPTAPATPAPVNGSFQMGLVSGSSPSYQLPWLQQLGTHTARIEYAVGTSAASMATVMDQYAKAGVRPLLMASFDDRLPSDAEAQNLASWAAAYGPGGTFWKGKTYAKTPGVTDIEFGNETSYSYQFSDNSLSTYAARAATYAQRAKEAAVAIRAANANVGLLAIGDNAVNQDAWVKNMFKAVPDLGDYVAGWTIHPYGPNWATRIDSTINSTKAAGSRDLPIWITEWGLSTDNGRCLDDNYGYDKCMSYSEAATTLHSVLSGMQSRYGSRLGAFFLFQANDQYATGTSTSRERYFGALQQLGAAKGAYTSEVMQDLAAN
ncbi:MAG TPA: glycosyl hydrolase, partial [Conexibacter sp.]|nr:glycosyl hydrolase [Conexibacter sp.]